MTIWSNLS